MPRRLLSPLAIAITLALATLSAQPVWGETNPKRSATVGVVLDGPHRSGEDPLVDKIDAETKALLRDEFSATFPDDKVFAGDWTESSISNAFDRALADDDVDIVLAEGLVASHLAVQRKDLPKPTIALFVVDPTYQGAPVADGTSGRENLAYLTLAYGLRQAIRDFHQLFTFEDLALLVPAAFLEAAPDFSDRLQREYRDESIRLHPVPIRPVSDDADVSRYADAIPDEAEAVYVAPLPMLTTTQFAGLMAAVHRRGLPTFAHDGADDVERGALAGMAPPPDIPQFARRVALYLQRILLGEDPADFGTSFMHGSPRLVLNMKAARQLNFRPDWTTLSEAKLIHREERDTQTELDLEETVRRALDANPETVAGRRSVAAARREIARARTAFFPRADLSLNGRIIDSDRAEASFGNEPERQLSAEASASQLAFSEQALANIQIQKRQHESRQFDQETLELDVVQTAAGAYLNVLAAKTALRIGRDNLERTRSNLSLARTRQSIGVSGPSEVYRWEARIANAKREVLEAEARVAQAENTLNRLLARSQTREFTTEDATLQTPYFLGTQRRLQKYISNPWDYAVFRDFVARRAIENSPELDSLEAQIAAQERRAKSARRAFYLPTVGLQAAGSWDFLQGGEGTEFDLGLPPEFAAQFPELDDWEWSVGFSVSIPLFDRALRFVELDQARATTIALRARRRAVRSQVELRVRNVLQQIRVSWPNLELSRQAAEASRKNLELVTDAYSRGAVDILELLDAQSAAFRAEQNAARAVYDFLGDMIDVERATGEFYLFKGDDARDAFFEKLDRYFQKHGGRPASEEP